MIGGDKKSAGKMTVLKNYTYNKLIDVSMTETSLEANNGEVELIKSLVLCSDATYENGQGTGDPTEIALVVLGSKYNLLKTQVNKILHSVNEVDFKSGVNVNSLK